MSEPTAAWRIDRAELVYSSPEHNRWQLYQRTPYRTDSITSNKAPYRPAIQRFLDSVYELLKAALRESRSSSFAIRDGESAPAQQDDAFHFCSGIIEGSALFRELRKDVAWETVISAYRDSLSEAGILHKDRVDGLLREMLFAMNQSQAREAHSADKCKESITSTAGLELLSILPIKKDWDLWGMCLPNWLSDLQHRTPLGQEFYSSGSWQRFYAARLIYDTTVTTNTKSRVLLNYDVKAQVFAFDPDREEFPKEFPLTDYFDYCYLPPTGSNEEEMYCTYALLIDELQRRLQGISGKTTEHDNVYMIVYPIMVWGRTHFLQIYLSFSYLTRTPSASDLWRAWRPIHQILESANFREYLSRHLEQVGALVFQHRMLWWKANQEMNVSLLKEEFCNHVNEAFPIQALWLPTKENRGRIWQYESLASEQLVEDIWGSRDGAEKPKLATSLKIDQEATLEYILPSIEEEGAVENLARRGYADQVLRKQWAWAATLVATDIITVLGGDPTEAVLSRLLTDWRQVVVRMDADERREWVRDLQDAAKWVERVHRSVEGHGSLYEKFGTIRSMVHNNQKDDAFFRMILNPLEVGWRELMCCYPYACSGQKKGLLSHPYDMKLDKDGCREFFQTISQLEFDVGNKCQGLYTPVKDWPGFEILQSGLERQDQSRPGYAVFSGRAVELMKPLLEKRCKKSPCWPVKCSGRPEVINYRYISQYVGISPGDLHFIHTIAMDNGGKHKNPLLFFDWRISPIFGESRFETSWGEFLWCFGSSAGFDPVKTRERIELEAKPEQAKILTTAGLADIVKVVCYRYHGVFKIFSAGSQLSVRWTNGQFEVRQEKCPPYAKLYYYCLIGDRP